MFQQIKSYLAACAEPHEFSKFSRATAGRVSVLDDDASMGLAQIMGLARTMGTLVYLTGSGGDEILSDYGFNGTAIYPQSTIGGKFPKNLSEIFPWAIFFLGTMRDYIMKEELVGGAFGIDSELPVQKGASFWTGSSCRRSASLEPCGRSSVAGVYLS